MLDPVSLKMLFQCMCQKSVRITTNIGQVTVSAQSGQRSADDMSQLSPLSRLLDKITSLLNSLGGNAPGEQTAPGDTRMESGVSPKGMTSDLPNVQSGASANDKQAAVLNGKMVAEVVALNGKMVAEGAVLNGKMVADGVISLVDSINQVLSDIDKEVAGMREQPDVSHRQTIELSGIKKDIINVVLHGSDDSVGEAVAKMGIFLEKNGLLSVSKQSLEYRMNANVNDTVNVLKNVCDTLYERIHLLINAGAQMYAVSEKTQWGRGNGTGKAQALLDKSFKEQQEALESKLNTVKVLIEGSYSLQGFLLQEALAIKISKGV
ncbi:MAG: hypothetical protein NTX36_14465 [Proteobacteria bacterium]|nr:hypothetical protein [Pseudomonadota bacterium]